MRAGPISPGLGIDPGRSDGANRLGDVVGSEPAGKNYRRADEFDDAAADPPVMRDAESPDLAVQGPMAVEQQKIRDAFVEAGKRQTLLACYRNASHQQTA